jgi:formylglycine-generating enzyme required for sulfatase activity
MERELARNPEPKAAAEDKDRLARRQAHAAAVLLQLGHADKVWPLLRHSEEPRVRTFLIEALSQLAVSPSPLITRLEQQDEKASVRFALLLCLEGFAEEKLSFRERQPLIGKLKRWYREDRDPGVHSAIDWLLRRWHQGAEVARIDGDNALRNPGDRRWYVNGQGQTLAIIHGPGKITIGSPPGEPNHNPALETLRERRLDYSFAVGTKEVTVGQFEEFLRANPQLPKDALAISRQYSTYPDGPVVGVMWFQAIQYCRWLAEKENLDKNEMCYGEIVKDIQQRVSADDEAGRGIRLPPDYVTRTGYRLPTEAEWEYACRAGAVTSRPYGSAEIMLDQYGWYVANGRYRAQTVGLLKPNDFGLFDMLGNASEWTNDKADRNMPLRELNDDERLTVWNQDVLLFRGGAVNSLPRELRSASRNSSDLMRRQLLMGFRVARTQR